MPGIYSRDNFAQLLANAIENAQARRQATVDREAARTNSNVQAIGNFAKALGRTYETWGSDEEKLAALQKEREEAIKAQQEHDDYLRGMLNREQPAGPSTNDYYAQAMQGYKPASSYVVPNYSEVLRKRGLY
jgi:hypothetical protein